jgi:hypothetical protein
MIEIRQIAEVAADVLTRLRDRGWTPRDQLVERLRALEDRTAEIVERHDAVRYDVVCKVRQWPDYSPKDHREAVVALRWIRFLADLRQWEVDGRHGLRPLPPRFVAGNPDDVPVGSAWHLICAQYDYAGVDRPIAGALIDACKPAKEGGDDATDPARTRV